MHYTTLKINEIAIDYFSDNNSKFAKAMGTSEANIRNYRNGTLPKVDFIIKLCENLEINFEWFLLGTGKKNASYDKGHIPHMNDDIINQERIPEVGVIDKFENDTLVLVSKNDTIEYVKNYNDTKFLKKLKKYNFPNLNNGACRMFQVSGHDMYPALDDEAFVVGEWVRDWAGAIKDDQVYVIISLSHGIIIRRILNRIDESGNLYCKSDNRKGYSGFFISVEDVLEIWEYKMHISYKLPNSIDLYDRVNDLEARLSSLENKK